MHFDVPEGATPLEDASGLKLPGSPTYADLCAAEAENILGAMDIHLKRRKNPSRIWMTADYICRVHRDMYKEVWEWAGMIRSHQTDLGVSAYLIREELVKLCQDIHFWDKQEHTLSILERAVRIHHRLSWIHPFTNGNGRHARLMADIYLHSHVHPLPLWPHEELPASGTVRAEYLETMRVADNGDYLALKEFTMRYLELK